MARAPDASSTLPGTQKPATKGSGPAHGISHAPGPAPALAQAPAPELPATEETETKLEITVGHWSNEEHSAFFEALLGADSDAIFQKITLSSNKCWKDVRDSSLEVLN